jgi:hypothetical protein
MVNKALLAQLVIPALLVLQDSLELLEALE